MLATDFSLHHIGLLVEDISLAGELYIKSLGYEKRSEVIHDATQTAFVQFLRLPGDSVYLELISPDGPNSKLTNSLRKGQSLHHLCYSTTNIQRSCNELREKGFYIIHEPIPAIAFGGRPIAWLMSKDKHLLELVERGVPGEL